MIDARIKQCNKDLKELKKLRKEQLARLLTMHHSDRMEQLDQLVISDQPRPTPEQTEAIKRKYRSELMKVSPKLRIPDPPRKKRKFKRLRRNPNRKPRNLAPEFIVID